MDAFMIQDYQTRHVSKFHWGKLQEKIFCGSSMKGFSDLFLSNAVSIFKYNKLLQTLKEASDN